MWEEIKKIKSLALAMIMVGTLVISLCAMRMVHAKNITRGDAQRMVNAYPPGGSTQLWPNDPTINPQVDIRPFPTNPDWPDFVGYDQNLYCENDWHVLAIRFGNYVFANWEPTDECISCIGFAPATKRNDAVDWLNQLQMKFWLDGVEVVGVNLGPVKALVYGDAEFVANDCGCKVSAATDVAAQWTKTIEPAMESGDHPLGAGMHTFGITVTSPVNASPENPYGLIFDDQVEISVLPADAPECLN
jgi:hypothetical protein